jgi:predicted dehydrogenase
MTAKIRLCLVGGGRAGKIHAQSVTRNLPNGKFTTLVEPELETRINVARQFNIENTFTTLEGALEKGNFDAVVITTPTITHCDLAVMAANEGKHIFLEKPMALTIGECNAISNVIQQKNVILQIGFMRRFDPEFITAAQRIQMGEIGKPMMIKSLTHGPGLPPPWARDLTTSNGMLAEVNSHDWDTVRWLMGSNYQRVYTEIANFKGLANKIDTLDFYDNALVTILFQNGGLGSISGICPCGYGYDARVEIVGEKGIIQIGELKGQAVVICTDRDQGLITPIYRTWPERFAWGYINEMEHFIESVRIGIPPKVGAEEGRWAVAGVLAATRSFQENRPVLLSEIM